MILSQSGKNKTAIEWFDKAIKMDSTQLYPIQWQITNYKLLGDIDKANYWSERLSKNINDLRNQEGQIPAYYESLISHCIIRI